MGNSNEISFVVEGTTNSEQQGKFVISVKKKAGALHPDLLPKSHTSDIFQGMHNRDTLEKVSHRFHILVELYVVS